MTVLPMVMVEIGGSGFAFSAAHTGLHNGLFEPLHGHTFTPALRLFGTPDPATGMFADFSLVKAALREALEPLRRRTLMPGRAKGVTITEQAETVEVTGGGKRYVLPASDVMVLPVANTTTEEIAGHLLDRIWPTLAAQPRLSRVEMELAEASDTRVTVSREVQR